MLFMLDPCRTAIAALVINGLAVLVVYVIYKAFKRILRYLIKKGQEGVQHEKLEHQPTGSGPG